jgi:ATP-dependent 26S proteasome regulatory subunit
MQTFKNIEPSSASYSQAEYHWWICNDAVPSRWDAVGVTVNRKKFEEWKEENFETIIEVSDFEEKGKERVQETFILKPKKNILGSDDKVFFRFVINNSLSKTEIDYNVSAYWNKNHKGSSLIFEQYLESFLKLVIHKKRNARVHMVVVDRDGSLTLRAFDINTPDIDLELNYGKEWAEKHEYLIKSLTKDKKKGIALLHGLPGTGKSMYIRYLISFLSRNIDLIYLPNQLINSITDPSFIPLMAEHPNSILIIEDAEEAIKSRKLGGTTVDKILNLSDGILSDFLGTQIICTFNNEDGFIDDALLRKGRLILKHEFKKLSVENSQALSDKLGFKTKIDREMSLTEIYNQEEKFNDPESKNRIGFSM